jgi:hypothetical protein
MKVLIDGVEVQVNNDVKVIYDLPSDIREIDTEVHLTFTQEGMIGDLWQGDELESIGLFL